MHIRDECSYILSVIPEDFSKDAFISDETLKRAVVRSLEIIGEATKKIPADFKYNWNSLQWNYMAGRRDKLILIIWESIIPEFEMGVKNKIPEIYPKILEIIGKD